MGQVTISILVKFVNSIHKIFKADEASIKHDKSFEIFYFNFKIKYFSFLFDNV